MKQHLLATGMTGLLGSRISQLLRSEFEIHDLSAAGISITDAWAVEQFIATNQGVQVVHFAAKAQVDECEEDKKLGVDGLAWKINVLGTKNVVDAAYKTNKRVITISTDFVFDGKKDWYDEKDKPNPINWYGVTKFEGEKITLSHKENTVVRLAYPYMAKNLQKLDFLHVFLQTLQSNKELTVLTDHYFTPTFVDDIASALRVLLIKKLTGIVHVVGSSVLTPFQGAQEVTKVFKLSSDLLKPITTAEFYRNRAQRPLQLRLKNDTITSCGVRMHSFTEGLLEIKKQLHI